MNRFFKSALAALPLLMLASCAEDDLAPGAEIAENSETRYLKVTLTSPTASPVSRWSDDNTKGDGTKENPGTQVVGGDGYYADGTEEENKIETLDFYFYTRDKQYHSHVNVTVTDTDGKPTTATPTDNPRPTSPNISGFYHCNVPIQLTQGQEIPSYVVCIVNAVAPTQYQEKSMKEAQLTELTSLYSASSVNSSDVKYFGMSNSVYYGRDDVTGNDGELVMAAPFTTDKLLTKTTLEELEDQALHPQEGEDQNEIEKYTINIPVERYAVKVNMDLSSLHSKISDYVASQSVASTLAEGENSTTINLKFIPQKWGVNGTEQSFYFIKSFRGYIEGSFSPSLEFSTKADLDPILFTGWNNPAHKRCFWARTPTYYSNQYPLTADDIKDLPEDEKGKYNLQYKSWEDCAVIKDDVANLGKYTEYVKETTMMVNRLNGTGLGDNYLPTASLPSVILLGQYQVDDAPVGTDFYLYGKNGKMPIVYSGEDPREQIDGTSKILDRMLLDQNILLKKNGDKYVPISRISDFSDFFAGSDEEKLAQARSIFNVEHPSKEVREYAVNSLAASNGSETSELHIAEDIVVLQVVKDVNAETTDINKMIYFYNPKYTYEVENPVTGEKTTVTGGYQPLSFKNLIQVNHLLYQNLGGANFYKDGMAYFTAPIQHWGWYRTDNPNRYVTDESDNVVTDENGNKVIKPWTEWNWQEMKTGDFGVVRNHEYTMSIGSISGLGTGIADPKDPIVPPADKVDYAVHFHVNIQRWAVLPVQEWNW